jgi:hypothetical protein
MNDNNIVPFIIKRALAAGDNKRRQAVRHLVWDLDRIQAELRGHADLWDLNYDAISDPLDKEMQAAASDITDICFRLKHALAGLE